MQDLTSGSITRHLLKTSSFMLVMMVFGTLYFLIDLYWVGRLGTEAVAAVGIAGNLSFVVLALGQMLGVGATAVISHAAGRKDHADARHLLHQALGLSLVVATAFLGAGMALHPWYAATMSADPATARLASDYLRWFVPAMALQFPLGVMGASLRGVGMFKPGMLVSTGSVILNIVLSPIMIFGWITGVPFGVAGAAISSLISVIVGLAWMSLYFIPRGSYLRLAASDWRPELRSWRRMLAIGLPAGVEFAMMAAYQVIVFTLARPFGPAAQAGFSIGVRLIQAGFMPVVALGFAVAPVAGQNFGARLPGRVRATFRNGASLAAVAMTLLAILCHVAPEAMIRVFASDPAVVGVGREYLEIISLNFVASGLIFVTSSMFQAMGNTVPSLFTSAARVLLLFVPAIALARMPGFTLTWIWYLSVTAVWVQLGLSLWLLRLEFSRRLDFGETKLQHAATA